MICAWTSFGQDRLQSILPAPRGREKSAVKSAFGLLVQWYRRPDQFDSFNRYLATKGLELAVRLLVIGSLTTVIIAMTLLRFSDAGVHNHVTSVVNAVIIAVTIAVIVLFCLLPEITRRWSYFFVAYCEVGVFVGVFLNNDPFIGLIQCVLFVLIGGYIAYFHNARLQAVHIALSIVVLAVVGRKVAVYADPALATALCLIIATGIVVIPFACQFVLSLLGSDADSSDVDPLTGLLNRRGLQRAVVEMGRRGMRRASRRMSSRLSMSIRSRASTTHRGTKKAISYFARLLIDCGGAAVRRRSSPDSVGTSSCW